MTGAGVADAADSAGVLLLSEAQLLIANASKRIAVVMPGNDRMANCRLDDVYTVFCVRDYSNIKDFLFNNYEYHFTGKAAGLGL